MDNDAPILPDAGTVTADDVAAVAGVSRWTVARAFKADASISARSREKVLAAAERLGYAPDLAAELQRLNARIAASPVDLCFAGIGENSHLAFNDPPADFETEAPYIVVNLDQACRQQQFGEGWFPTFDDVPQQAVSMSIRQIMKSASIILSVPDRRKAAAVKGTVEGPVTPACPASIVRRHADCTLYIDDAAATELAR